MTSLTGFTPGHDWVWYAPHTTDQYNKKEIAAVTRTLKNGWLTTGKATAEFEEKTARLFGKRYGLFVNSGSSANLISLAALGLPKGSEVITPACTFSTTLNPLLSYGLTPVFVDVALGRYVMEPERIERAITRKTSAIMVPHLIGNFADMPAIKKLIQGKNIKIIEDSCDAIGGTIHGKPSGKWSDAVTTSFYASHIITTGGAGGIVATNDKALRERMRVMRDWGRGISRHDENIRSRLASYRIDGRPYDSAFVFVERGYNLRPTEMQAAFGLAQLPKLKTRMRVRARNFRALRNFFSRYEEFFILPEPLPNSVTNWLAFPLTIRKDAPFTRNAFVTYLEGEKIQTRPLFSGNILKHPAYRGIPHRISGTLAYSDLILQNSLLLGLHHGITEPMITYLSETVEDFLKKYVRV